MLWTVKNTFLQVDNSSEGCGAMQRQRTDSVLENRDWRCGKGEFIASLPTVPTVDSLPGMPHNVPTVDSLLDWDSMSDASDIAENANLQFPNFQRESMDDAAGKVGETAMVPAFEVEKNDANIDGLTTLMLRNVPVHYSQSRLMMEINRAGFLGCFDFFYLPKDPRSHKNRGFAFLNFETTDSAKRFYEHFHGQRFQNHEVEEFICVVPADLQGFEANARRYASTQPGRRQQSQPVFFKALPMGVQLALPHSDIAPTQTLMQQEAEIQSALDYVNTEGVHIVQCQPQFHVPAFGADGLPDWPFPVAQPGLFATGQYPAAEPLADAMGCQQCITAKLQAQRFCTLCGSRCH